MENKTQPDGLGPQERGHHRRRRGLRLRRLLGIGMLASMGWGAYWLIALSGMADPVLLIIEPLYRQAAEAINDPLGVDWGSKFLALATVFISHIGMIFYIVDETT